MVDRDEQFQRNNELFRIFMQEVLNNPAFSEAIPQDAEVIFVPEHDPELKTANLALAKACRAEGKRVVLVRVTLMRQTRTIFVPKLELVEAAS